MSALQFQAGDLIPIPIEDAVLDFAILGTSTPGADPAREPTMQVLLVAAYEATVTRLVSAVEAGGLDVGAVDLIPLALTRALARPVGGRWRRGRWRRARRRRRRRGHRLVRRWRHRASQCTKTACRSSCGCSAAVVASSPTRSRPTSAVPAETAESLKRALGDASRPTRWSPGPAPSVDRPLSVLLDEVRSSIDYYRNQPGSAQLRRVVVTGGSAQLPGLPERLSALVGVPGRARVHARPPADRRHRLRARRAPAPRAVPSRPRSGSRSAVRNVRNGHRPAARAAAADVEADAAASIHRVIAAAAVAGVVVLGRPHVPRAQRSGEREVQERNRAGRRSEAPFGALRAADGGERVGRTGAAIDRDAQGGRQDRARPGRGVASRSSPTSPRAAARRLLLSRSRARTPSQSRRRRRHGHAGRDRRPARQPARPEMPRPAPARTPPAYAARSRLRWDGQDQRNRARPHVGLHPARLVAQQITDVAALWASTAHLAAKGSRLSSR